MPDYLFPVADAADAVRAVTLQSEAGYDFIKVYSYLSAEAYAAALATALMALYARYPIAQAPGMGENFFFVLSVLPAVPRMTLTPTVSSYIFTSPSWERDSRRLILTALRYGY